jgi:HK97 family phage portal protein
MREPLMGIRQRLASWLAPGEKRSASSWDLLRAGGIDTEAGMGVSAPLAENLSATFACVQAISETVATLPLVTYLVDTDGSRHEQPLHPVARLFGRQPNDQQTAPEFVEMQTAACLLKGNSYAEIVRDARGAPVALHPMNPDLVSVARLPGTRRVRYDYADPIMNRTRHLLPEEVFHLKDRSDDGIVGKSRLARAREAFATAAATERYAGRVYANSASLSGVFVHPQELGDQASARLRKELESLYTGAGNAGRIAILEEGMSFSPTSISPEDAQMLDSRRFGVEQIARLFGVPPPIIGDLSRATFSNIEQLGKWFADRTIRPWLTRWERALERSLLSEESRRTHRLEFDMDLLLRGDLLGRMQAYRIGREIGVYSAADLRSFESLNPRTDPDAETFLSPLNMASEQTGRPRVDAGE